MSCKVTVSLWVSDSFCMASFLNSQIPPGRVFGDEHNQVWMMFYLQVHIIEAEMIGPAATFFEEVNGQVDRNPINPSVERGIPLEAFQSLESSYETLLGEIVSVFMTGSHVVQSCVDPLVIAGYELVEGSKVTLLRSLYQSGVITFAEACSGG